MPNGFVRVETCNHPQFGHILKSNSLTPRFRRVRKPYTELKQLPQIHSRSPNRVPTPPELDFARNRKQLRQPPPEANFMPILLACLELRTDLRRTV